MFSGWVSGKRGFTSISANEGQEMKTQLWNHWEAAHQWWWNLSPLSHGFPLWKLGVVGITRWNEQSSWRLTAFSGDCQDTDPPGSVHRKSEHGWIQLSTDGEDHWFMTRFRDREARGQEHTMSPWALPNGEARLFEDLLSSFSIMKAHLVCLSL